MPRLRHLDNLNSARFVTFSCYHRYRLLTDTDVIQLFLNELDNIRKKYDLRLFGYVIMPEHVHLVIHPRDGLGLGRIIGELKSLSAQLMLPLLQGQMLLSFKLLKQIAWLLKQLLKLSIKRTKQIQESLNMK